MTMSQTSQVRVGASTKDVMGPFVERKSKNNWEPSQMRRFLAGFMVHGYRYRDPCTIYIGSYGGWFALMPFFRDCQDAEIPSIPIQHNFILQKMQLCVFFFFVFLACRNTFGEGFFFHCIKIVNVLLLLTFRHAAAGIAHSQVCRFNTLL